MVIKENNENNNVPEKKVKSEIKKEDTFDDILVKAKNLFKNKDIHLPVPICIKSLANCNKIIFLKIAMRNSTLHEDLINEIMSDLIIGAYQNRREAYSVSLNENCLFLADEMGKIQNLRQSADNHLLNIIKTIKNFNQPATQINVKEAQQVNVAEKQVNISQKADSQNTPNP